MDDAKTILLGTDHLAKFCKTL